MAKKLKGNNKIKKYIPYKGANNISLTREN